MGNKGNQGFTLLELSIVIVIIGLIVAGISAGQSLVRQAQLREVTTFANSTIAAINSFDLQYDALPGDMTNADDYWDTALSCTDALSEGGTAGCNGDGNGLIDTVDAGTDEMEGYRAWQQMAHTGVIDGSYSGLLSGTVACTPGVGVPNVMGNGGVDLNNDGTNNYMQFGAAGTLCDASLFTVAEMQALDLKADDGAASAGVVRGIDGASCLDGADYDLANEGEICVMRHLL